MRHNKSKPKSHSHSKPQQKSFSTPVVRSHGAAAADIPRNWRVVVGDHAIREALSKSSSWIKKVWIKQGFESSQFLREIMDESKRLKCVAEIKSESVLDKVYPNHQGALLFLEGRPRLDFEGLKNFEHSTLLALDGVEDPHNLGAILRTSWLTGVHGVFGPEDRSVGLSPTVHKVACGGVESVAFEQISQFHSTLETLKKQGYWVFGLSHKAEKSLCEIQIPEKIIWVLGAEDKGIRTTTEKACDELVRLPQGDAAASYNVSVATGMTLFETLRQRQLSARKTSSSKKST